MTLIGDLPAFDDILLLDMPENMNSGKTHAFLSWAAANATVPDVKWVAPDRTSPEEHNFGLGDSALGLGGSNHQQGWTMAEQEGSSLLSRTTGTGDGDGLYHPVYQGERRPDFIVKADEDSFIMIGELERRLRVLPRKHTYWGCETTA